MDPTLGNHATMATILAFRNSRDSPLGIGWYYIQSIHYVLRQIQRHTVHLSTRVDRGFRLQHQEQRHLVARAVDLNHTYSSKNGLLGVVCKDSACVHRLILACGLLSYDVCEQVSSLSVYVT